MLKKHISVAFEQRYQLGRRPYRPTVFAKDRKSTSSRMIIVRSQWRLSPGASVSPIQQ